MNNKTLQSQSTQSLAYPALTPSSAQTNGLQPYELTLPKLQFDYLRKILYIFNVIHSVLCRLFAHAESV